jgi:DNA polymerase-3 subunit gamma/tau
MDNFIVSARKYRPDNFESVVGQDAITQTLKNSIKINQLAQAYLFCGPRGVGKTTCARIFAKTINCSNLTADYEACNECESCVAFNNLRSLNIHELDAASNNSVDDIRNLIDQVRIPPQIGSYSVYIIDEVHMLSSSAFNAFLKTLEEPPKHVIFILATTEKHKIIPTILSRCQVFDFNRISVEDIRSRLEFVAQREGIRADHDSLHIIAQKADGAMRDALSIFDQIVSFSGKEVTYESTIKNLNILDYETYFKITDAFITCNYTEALIIFDNVLKKGFEAGYFINGLASHFRDLLVCKDPGTVELLEVGNKTKAKYLEHAQKCSTSFLFKAINIANQCDLSYKQSQNKRLLVELALLNICNIEKNSEEASEKKNDASEPVKSAQQAIQTATKEDVNTSNEQQKQVSNSVLNKTYTINTEEKKAETPLNKNVSQSTIRNISLKDLANEVEKPNIQAVEEPKIEYTTEGIEDFDDEKLKYVWVKYAETLRENPRLFTFLIGHIPQKIESYKYAVSVDSQISKNKVESILHDIIVFIRKELNNKNFELTCELDEQASVQKKVFKTDREKLQDVIDKNPAIQKFMDEFNLDLE